VKWERDTLSMSTVVVTIRLALLPGVDAADFLRAMNEKTIPGVEVALNRAINVVGQRLWRDETPNRSRQYLWAIEFNGIERLDLALASAEGCYTAARPDLDALAVRVAQSVAVLEASWGYH